MISPLLTSPTPQSSGAGDTSAAQRAMAEQQIRAAYQQYLGRSPSDSEIQSHLAAGTSAGQIQNAVNSIAASSERAAYLASHQNEDGSYQPDAHTLAANTATQATTPPPGPTGNTDGSAAEFGQAWLASGSNDLNAFMAQWNSAHPNVQAAFSGKKNHDITIGGQTYHAVNSDGAKFWMGGGGSSSGPGSSFSIDPSYLAPFTKDFNAGPDANQPTFRAPAAFKMPTKDDVLADPSYQFRFGEGLHALDNGAAARGLINSGGTLTDEQTYGQNFASQEYGNIFNRNFNLWNTDWQHALDEYGTAVNRSNEAYGRARQGYLDQRDTFQQNQSLPFDKILRVGSLGASAASA